MRMDRMDGIATKRLAFGDFWGGNYGNVGYCGIFNTNQSVLTGSFAGNGDLT
jgi:hypothetical protein